MKPTVHKHKIQHKNTHLLEQAFYNLIFVHIIYNLGGLKGGDY